VALERFQVDDVSQILRGTGAVLKVPAGHVRFEFDYAGLSFVAPLKVRYRYMLEGFDHGWTEAGARRNAYYTNIPPGKYTFRVQAANNDGLWNTEGAALSFELRPHFYQTWWFYALLLACVVAAIVLLLATPSQPGPAEFRAVLGERSRIAREIHDTLAQGYVGISVQLELLAELLRQRKLDDAGKHLDKTRDYVREGWLMPAIDLGAPDARCGRDHAARENCGGLRKQRRRRAQFKFQSFRRLSFFARGNRARIAAHSPGGRP